MSDVAQLLADCHAHGVRLSAAAGGGLTIDAPQDALTPDLVSRLKDHKAELLPLLRPILGAATIDRTDANAIWQAALDQLEGDPEFPSELIGAIRTAGVRWVDDSAQAVELVLGGREVEEIDWPPPCPKCQSLEQWQDLADRWRCLNCDPPSAARRFAHHAARLRRRTEYLSTTRQKG